MPIAPNDHLDLSRLIKEYKEKETVDAAFNANRLLELMIACTDALIHPEQDATFNQHELWIALSACGFKLGQENQLKNLQIPWQAIAYLKRVICYEALGSYRNMSHLAEETVYMSKIDLGPHMALIKHALTRIIQFDLTNLHTALLQIQQQTYQDHHPQANGIRRLVAYERDEYYLAKIESQASRINTAAPDLGRLAECAYYFLVLGEAIHQLSPEVKRIFDPALCRTLNNIRQVFCHPERHQNKILVQRFLQGNITQPGLDISQLLPIMPYLQQYAAAAREQYVDRYQDLPTLSARTPEETAALERVWQLILNPPIVNSSVFLPAYVALEEEVFTHPIRRMQIRRDHLQAYRDYTYRGRRGPG